MKDDSDQLALGQIVKFLMFNSENKKEIIPTDMIPLPSESDFRWLLSTLYVIDETVFT